MHELIGDITLCILFAWWGHWPLLSRRPPILACLVAGFFIGPFGMGWVKSRKRRPRAAFHPAAPIPHENVVLFETRFCRRGRRGRHAALHYDAGAGPRVRVIHPGASSGF